MQTNKLLCFSLVGLAIVLTSCVPQRLLEEEKTKRKSCEEELSSIKTRQQEFEAQNKEMKITLNDVQQRLDKLQKDTALMGSSYRLMALKYDKLNGVNEQLLEKYNKMMDININDTKKISTELQATQESLLKRQDELKALEASLNEKQKTLDQVKAELQLREKKIAEMQEILKRKDDAVIALKNKVTDALLGFENKGLTITQKNGKVYVSLDESLLFASGKTNVEAKGAEALKKLASVLEQNTDINVMVEGHTDNVPMKGSGDIKDNWDLSVMRATSIIKILTSNKNVDPKRLTAAGRGEYFPIDPASTSDARKKNRRTEIILTPKLDELFKILETN
ncbi:MAG: OmpA family protein [Bacteroidetes bacterium]|nr:OmpA family protein [Bacteroidota bacterium]